MKYYSDVTKKIYPTQNELEKAEAETLAAQKQHEAEVAAKKRDEVRKNSERKARAAEVEVALKEAKEANEKYQKLLTKFINDYGYFHTSITESDASPWSDCFNMLSSIFTNWR